MKTLQLSGVLSITLILALICNHVLWANAQEETKKEDPKIEATFKDGLKLKSSDGNFDAHIGGRFLEHARFVLDKEDDPRTKANSFFIRQARLEMSGTFYKDFEFKVQTDFPTGSSSTSGTLQDAYMGWKKYEICSIRLGQFKEPFSFEETTSTRFINFVERSDLNNLAHGRDIGFMLHGKLFSKIVGYEAGVFNGQGRAVNDGDDRKEVAARLRVSPFATQEIDLLKGLMLGVAGTQTELDAGASAADGVTKETGTTFLDITSTTLNGKRTRKGVELVWAWQSIGLAFEYAKRKDPTVKGTIDDSLETTAWYVAGTYLITGEQKVHEKRIKPSKPFNVDEGTWGAVELAARMSNLSYDNEVFENNFADTESNSNEVKTVTLGANWWLTQNYRVSLNYVTSRYDDDVLSGSKKFDDEKAILARFQMDF